MEALAFEASKDRFANLFKSSDEAGWARFELTGEPHLWSLEELASAEVLDLFREDGVLGLAGGGGRGSGGGGSVVPGNEAGDWECRREAARVRERLGVVGLVGELKPESNGAPSRDLTVWRRLLVLLLLLRGVAAAATAASLASSWLMRASMAAARCATVADAPGIVGRLGEGRPLAAFGSSAFEFGIATEK